MRDVLEEPRLVDMDAQQLRELVDDDDQADAGLEPHQDGLGDEVGHETEPQHRRDQQHHAHHDGESRGGGDQLGGTASGATATSVDPVRIAMVVVVLTLSGREVPSNA